MAPTRALSAAASAAAAVKLEAERLLCTSNRRDDVCGSMAPPPPKPLVMVKPDVDEERQFDEHFEAEEDEGSSSFGGSEDTNDRAGSSCQGMEADSFSSIPAGPSRTAEHLSKRKKVNEDWRKFIGPLAWRCQWLELRMKELLFQASKYDNELCLMKREKDSESELVKEYDLLPGMDAGTGHFHENNAMQRRTRKRVEEVTDISLYMKKHPIFSYYENKGVDNNLLVDDDNDLGFDKLKSNLETRWFLGTKEDNFVLQQLALKDILQSIDAAQCRLLSLRESLRNTILKEEMNSYGVAIANKNPESNADEVSSDEVHTPSTVSDCPLDVMSVEKASTSDDLTSGSRDSAGTNIIEKTVGFLIGSSEPALQHRMVDMCQRRDHVLVYSRKAKEEGHEHLGDVKCFTGAHKEPFQNQSLLLDYDCSNVPLDGTRKVGVEGESVDDTPKVDDAQKMVLNPCSTKNRRGRPRKKQKMSLIVAATDQNVNSSPVCMPTRQSDDVHIARTLPLSATKRKSSRVSSAGPSKKDGDSVVLSPVLSMRQRTRRASKHGMSTESPVAPAAKRKRTDKVFVVTSGSSRSGRIRKPKIY